MTGNSPLVAPGHIVLRSQKVTQAATLTLLGLIIGFTFSMAVSRYDQRKNYEAAEANAIGTEYVRADLLPAADAARVRELLKNYLDQRVRFYKTGDVRQLRQIDACTAQRQNELSSLASSNRVAASMCSWRSRETEL